MFVHMKKYLHKKAILKHISLFTPDMPLCM